MTTTVEPTTGEFGKSRTRKEDARLITGRTRWTDNIALPGTLHLALVRSPVAHARITGIDADEARALPGVLAVYTAADLGLTEASLPNAWPISPDQKAPQAPPLAVDTVHFAGEGVAVVVARDGELHPVQKAFNECHALQCGYCTPGMIMQAIDLLGDNPDPDEHEVREGIEGNLCRCTGYQNIVRAVQSAAQAMKPGVPAEAPVPVAGD